MSLLTECVDLLDSLGANPAHATSLEKFVEKKMAVTVQLWSEGNCAMQVPFCGVDNRTLIMSLDNISESLTEMQISRTFI